MRLSDRSVIGNNLVYIGLGSNIDPEANIRCALSLLAQKTQMIAISTMYRTQALGSIDSPVFINGVCEVSTNIPAHDLKFEVLRVIEAKLGRARTADRYAPRTIDLDILLYGNTVIREEDLVAPDSDIYTRPFIALPLYELAPELVVPGDGTLMVEVVSRLAPFDMQRLDELTSRIRKELLDEPRKDREPNKRTTTGTGREP